MMEKNIVFETTEWIAYERSIWIDSVIKNAIPNWKLTLLKKFNHPFFKKLINADVEIITEDIIAEFGNQTIVKLNGKVIGRMKYNTTV